MPRKDEKPPEGVEGAKAHARLLVAILGRPVTSYKEEPRDGLASGPFEHTWYADELAENDEQS